VPHHERVTAPGKKIKLEGFREVLRDPNWWMRDVFTALVVAVIVAAGSILGQKMIDDDRAQREGENLRFVRDASSPDPNRARPFSVLDLEGQHLVGLQIAGADFAYTDLADAFLIASDLSRGDFTRGNLSNANLSRTNLRGAYFGVDRRINDANQPGANLTGADLTDADLTGANLSHANLTGANLTTATMSGVFYDAATVWPKGFSPPPSRAAP
jgi:hypothetical protein